MARITTSSRAAAMSTAAVGDSPKMVVRSTTVERGSAEAPSSRLDRKSTRLNSSHDQISYAVFCLKKKTSIYNLTLHLPLLTYTHTTLSFITTPDHTPYISISRC